jgi:hypothetical protein
MFSKPKEYDQATQLLHDLRVIAQREDDIMAFTARVREAAIADGTARQGRTANTGVATGQAGEAGVDGGMPGPTGCYTSSRTSRSPSSSRPSRTAPTPTARDKTIRNGIPIGLDHVPQVSARIQRGGPSPAVRAQLQPLNTSGCISSSSRVRRMCVTSTRSASSASCRRMLSSRRRCSRCVTLRPDPAARLVNSRR